MIVKIRDVPVSAAKGICISNGGPGWNEDMEPYLGQSLEMQLALEYGNVGWYRYKDPLTNMTWLWPKSMLEIDLYNDPYIQSLEKL